MPNLQSSSYYTGSHTARTKAHYLAAASTLGRGSTIPDAPLTGNALRASDLCFANRATDALLELQSFDPSTDTPVEVLHNILLGVAKYLVNYLVKIVLKKNPNQMARLSKALKDYENSQGMSRKDYKVLLQILSAILVTEFANDSILSLITPSFVRLGRLCSLMFVRAVRYDYNMYINEVEKAVTSLIQELHHYDITCEVEGHNLYSSKPKVHLLTHLPNNLRRFGTALYYETEKGEQFNKHIHEHLMHTNRLNTSRDQKHSENTFAVFMLKESRDQHAHPFIGKVSSLRVEHY
ncbi:hypothetical protein F4703DRAFT_1850684 [Phycomyces blakesleeanus]